MESILTFNPTDSLILDIFYYQVASKYKNTLTYHSGLVTSTSTTVPGGGFLSPPPDCAKNLVFTRFFTTITVSFGLNK